MKISTTLDFGYDGPLGSFGVTARRVQRVVVSMTPSATNNTILVGCEVFDTQGVRLEDLTKFLFCASKQEAQDLHDRWVSEWRNRK